SDTYFLSEIFVIMNYNVYLFCLIFILFLFYFFFRSRINHNINVFSIMLSSAYTNINLKISQNVKSTTQSKSTLKSILIPDFSNYLYTFHLFNIC
ncbi:hypothetical protein L9F63_006407, partial [Diploptera punctata]